MDVEEGYVLVRGWPEHIWPTKVDYSKVDFPFIHYDHCYLPCRLIPKLSILS
jgi:hypothetical protein